MNELMEKYYGWGLPVDISTHGARIDTLIWALHVFMAVLFIGWSGFLIYSLVRFRAREGRKAVYDARHFKAPTLLEVFVAVFELFLLAAFATPIWLTLKKDLPSRDKAVEVRVVAQQFAWNIHYPGRDGVFGKTDPKLIAGANPIGLDLSDPAAKDDITTINQLHIPLHTPVLVSLTSKDVIHSFNLPVMRVKQDVIPGMVIPVWFEATRTGEFEIACAQLCGLGHYRMRGFFVVQTPEAFSAWLAEQAPQAAGVPVS